MKNKFTNTVLRISFLINKKIFIILLILVNISINVIGKNSILKDSDSSILFLRDQPCIVSGISYSPDTVLCKGETRILSVSGAAECVWRVGNDTIGIGSSVSVTPEDTTNYMFIVSQCIIETSNASIDDISIGDIITTDSVIVKFADWACAEYVSKTPAGIVYKIDENNIWIAATTIGNEPMISGLISGNVSCMEENGCDNTDQITNEDNFPAFFYCKNYDIAGLNWCLPSNNDLNDICQNLNLLIQYYRLNEVFFDNISLWSSNFVYSPIMKIGYYMSIENNTCLSEVIQINTEELLRQNKSVIPISQINISNLKKATFSKCYDTLFTTINVIPSPEIEISGTAGFCENSTTTLSVTEGYDSYQWYRNGEILTGETNTSITVDIVGNYSVEVNRSDNGCNSTKSIDVIQFPNDTLRYDTLICTNSTWPFSWHGVVFETREDTLLTTTEINANGCSAFVYLHASIAKQEKTTYIYSMCEGFDFTDSIATGFYVRYDTMSTVPSFVPPYTYPRSTTNDPVVFTYNREEPNTNPLGGCPIIQYELELTINPIIKTTKHDSICIGDEYYSEFLDTTFTPTHITGNSPIIITKIFAIGECRERKTLFLDVNPIYDTVYYESTCQDNDPFSSGLFHNIDVDFYGIPITEDTTLYLYETFSSKKGCDSTVGLFLTVYPSYNDYYGNWISVYDTTCQNNDTLFRSSNYPEFGIIDVSIDSLSLTHDTTLTRTLFAKTIHHCDSTVKLFLTVLPTFNDTLDNVIHVTDSICQNSELSASPKYPRFYNIDVSQADTILIIDSLFTSSFGCDSAVTLHLSVLPSYNDGLNNRFFVNDETCQSVDLFSSTTFPSFWGIDVSVDSLFITADTTLIIDSIFQTVDGCDSAVTLILVVHPSYDTSLNHQTVLFDTTFQSNFPYTFDCFNDINVNEHGDFIYNSVFTTASGCDSVVQLFLHVMQVYGIYLYDSTCQSVDLYNSPDSIFLGIDVSEIGVINFDTTFVSSIGTDSTIFYSLLVLPSYNSSNNNVIHIYDTVCRSVNLYVSDFDFNEIIIDSVGSFIYDSLFQTSNGCDSMVILTLNVVQTYDSLFNNHTIIYDTTFQNDIPYTIGDFENIDVSENGNIFMDSVFQTINGCDSLVLIYLFVKEVYGMIIYDTTCQSIHLYNSIYSDFSQIDVSGIGSIFIDTTYQSVIGTDSMINYWLEVVPSYNTELDNVVNVYDTVCQNMSAYLSEKNPMFNGISIEIVGDFIYDSTFTTTNSCDSNVVLHLSVLPEYSVLLNNYIEVFDTACQSEILYSYPESRFTEIDISQVSSFGSDTLIIIDSVFQTAKGCDSMVRLSLLVYPSYKQNLNNEIQLYDTICQDIALYTSVYPRFQSIDISFNGDYLSKDTIIIIDSLFKTIHDCDSNVILNLCVHPSYNTELNNVINVYDTVCQNLSVYVSDKNPMFNGISIENVGDFIYDSLFTTTNSCDSNVVLHLSVLPEYSVLLNNYIEVFDTACQSEILYSYPESRFTEID
ncbi:MAG: hypothetical protein PHR53_04890, partial [Bacteroidales bacterium]|nr:hypothetical protein [Bacteroidales bacterium]